jgi:hypothetical protein
MVSLVSAEYLLVQAAGAHYLVSTVSKILVGLILLKLSFAETI